MLIFLLLYVYSYLSTIIYIFYLINSQNKKPLFMRSSLSEILFIFLLAFAFACAGHNFLENFVNFFTGFSLFFCPSGVFLGRFVTLSAFFIFRNRKLRMFHLYPSFLLFFSMSAGSATFCNVRNQAGCCLCILHRLSCVAENCESVFVKRLARRCKGDSPVASMK